MDTLLADTHARPERLRTTDLMFLWPDDFGWPEDIGALAILDGAPLFDADGRFRIDELRATLAGRLHRAARLRQLLFTPRRGLGRPLWIDAPEFDIADHVRVAPLGEPADEARLLRVVEELAGRPLDRSRPLWQLWLVPGLPHGWVAMFVKLHHTMADGLAGLGLLRALLDPGAPEPDPPPWLPAPVPSARELLWDNVSWRLRATGPVLGLLAQPTVVRRWARAIRQELHDNVLDPGAPPTSLNRPIGPSRRLAVLRTRLDSVRDIGHRHDATVNDVLVAAVAGGVRELLRSRGEPVDQVLRAFVPVSLHRNPDEPDEANLDAEMVVPLPVGEPDAVRRLTWIARHTREIKQRPRLPEASYLPLAVLQRAAWRFAARQRATNVFVTNVPGPPRPLSLLGARVLELFPVTPISVNVTLGVGALSYAGQFNLTVVADRDGCPDVEVFAVGVQAALDSLAAENVPASR